MNLDAKSNSPVDPSDPLQRNEATKVFARWVSTFELEGHPKKIQQRVSNYEYASGEVAENLIRRRKDVSFYSIHNFDRTHPTIYFGHLPDLKEVKESNADVAIVAEDFEECLVISHEDGVFLQGPIYLRNPTAAAVAFRSGRKSA
ncbi:MAG: hypothetical protein SynsKO_13890 [Synoicihabitans sp.]